MGIAVLIFFCTRIGFEYPTRFLIASFLFVIGSLAPDVIEWSSYFTHRRFFHSKKFLLIISVATIVLFAAFYIFKIEYFLYPALFLIGYILHLLLDATTEMGLPSK